MLKHVHNANRIALGIASRLAAITTVVGKGGGGREHSVVLNVKPSVTSIFHKNRYQGWKSYSELNRLASTSEVRKLKLFFLIVNRSFKIASKCY